MFQKISGSLTERNCHIVKLRRQIGGIVWSVSMNPFEMFDQLLRLSFRRLGITQTNNQIKPCASSAYGNDTSSFLAISLKPI